MARFKFKGRGTIEANGYTFNGGEVTEVRDDDTATLRKLRGDPKSQHSHPSFEEVFE